MTAIFSRKNLALCARVLLLALIAIAPLPQPANSMTAEGLPEARLAAASAPANVFGVSVGAHLRPSTDYGNLLDTYNAAVGKNSAILMYFSSWAGRENGDAFSDYLVDLIAEDADTQPVIMITWQPTNGRILTGCAKNYTGFIGYGEILSGKCDTFIANYARQVAARPERYLMRFAHEMNISDTSYWPGKFGLKADAYVNMYRYVHDKFMAAHDAVEPYNDNVEWVWSPNYWSNPTDAWNYLHEYYPGDNYVDWIGLSGYNWYPRAGQPNRTFQNIYGNVDGTGAYYTSYLPGVLYDLACHYAKPVILAEIGAGGTDSTATNKVTWINNAYSVVPNYPFVRAVVWFNDFAYENSSDVDFRVTNINPPPNLHSSITPAYKAAIADAVYKSTLPPVDTVTPPATYCGNGAAVFSVTPLYKLAQRNTSTYHTLTGMLYNSHPTVTFPSLPSGFSAQLIDDQLNPPWGRARIRINVGSGVANGAYTVSVSVNGAIYSVQIRVVDQVWYNRLPAVSR